MDRAELANLTAFSRRRRSTKLSGRGVLDGFSWLSTATSRVCAAG